MSNPHANHQGEPGDTGSGGPSREAVEMMAEHLHEEHEYDHMWVWPEHAEDDGYRGNGGYVTITPTDVQCRLREMAARVLIRADQIAVRRSASAPTPPDRVGEEVGQASRLWGKTYDQIASEILTASRTGEATALVARLIADARAFERDALTSAPSPDPAGAGGDLGELERLSAAASQGDIIAEPYTDDHGGCYLMAGEIQIAAGLTEEDGAYLAALARDHRSGKLVASTGSGEETKGADDVEQRITNLHAARQSALRQMNEQAARAEAAEKRCVELERGAIHPALAVDVQHHRDEAYRTGWDDGYAEGHAKALAPSDAPSTTETDR